MEKKKKTTRKNKNYITYNQKSMNLKRMFIHR